MNLYYCFLHFPIGKIDTLITKKENAKQTFKTIQLIIDRIDCHKKAKIIYQSSNITKFFEEVNMVEEMGNFGIADSETVIYKILYDAGATDWEEKHEFNTSHLYRVWNMDSRILEDDLTDTLKYILDKESSYTESNITFLFISLFDELQQSRPFLSAYKDYPKDKSYKPIFIHIPYVYDFHSLENWLYQNTQTRKLNITDFRHQEKSPDYIKGKSPLLYDIRNVTNQNYIQSLLDTAIGDTKEREILINFDDKKKCYIRFEYEGDNPQNQYHAYHLVKPFTHERDIVAENLIPKRIIELLEYRRTL